MESGDFATFLILVPGMLVTFASIYLALLYSKWEPRSGLFLDSWYVWLAWVVSTLCVLVLCEAVSDFSRYGLFRRTPVILIAVLIANFVTIGGSIELLNRRTKKDKLCSIHDIDEMTAVGPSVIKISLVTAMASIVSLIIYLGLASMMLTVFDHYYRKPDMGIYD